MDGLERVIRPYHPWFRIASSLVRTDDPRRRTRDGQLRLAVGRRIAYTADANAPSVCDINAVVSCNNVFDQWQSSALGIPNTLISLPVFAVLASTGLAGMLGSRLSKPYLATLFGLSLFMAVFVTWYMYQSAFAMGALCLFCTAGAANIIIAGIGIGITGVAAAEHALGDGRAGRQLALLVDSRADLIAWLGPGLIIATMLCLGLA